MIGSNSGCTHLIWCGYWSSAERNKLFRCSAMKWPNQHQCHYWIQIVSSLIFAVFTDHETPGLLSSKILKWPHESSTQRGVGEPWFCFLAHTLSWGISGSSHFECWWIAAQFNTRNQFCHNTVISNFNTIPWKISKFYTIFVNCWNWNIEFNIFIPKYIYKKATTWPGTAFLLASSREKQKDCS